MKFKMLVVVLAILASPLAAQSVQDHVVQQLQAQGFLKIKIERTFLGRIRIEAYSDRFERELVINPNTGEILRDYWEPLDDDDIEDLLFDHLPDPHDDGDDHD